MSTLAISKGSKPDEDIKQDTSNSSRISYLTEDKDLESNESLTK